MIRSFANKHTEKLFKREVVTAYPPEIGYRGSLKLAILNNAISLEDLLVPPGNRLEKLHGDREGQHSIRINQQWRICFNWSDAGADNVEIVDYH